MRRISKLALVVLPALTLGLGYASAQAGATPVSASENPLTSLARAPLGAPPLRGTVQQRLAAGHYSYLALRTPDGALRWAVTMGKGEPVGTRVSVRRLAHSPDFYSARLQRHFEDLAFGVVSADSQEAR